MFEDILDIVKAKSIAFAIPGVPVTNNMIIKTERQLKIELPPSYKWWLRTFGQGQIKDDVIYGVHPAHDGWPNIVDLSKGDDGQIPDWAIVFSMGSGETFFFDKRHINEDGEFVVRVAVDELEDGREYAPTFADFLRRRIAERYS